MCRVNYVEQMNFFMEYVGEHKLTGTEIGFWVSLFNCANRKAQFDAESQSYEWPDDFFSVSNADFSKFGQFNRHAIGELRARLKDMGLIDFIPGSMKQNPRYRIFYLKRSGFDVVPDRGAERGGERGGDRVPEEGPAPAAAREEMPAKGRAYIININKDAGIRGKTDNTGENAAPPENGDDEDECDHRDPARARAREEAREAWSQYYLQEPLPAVLDCLADWGDGFEEGVIAEAIHMAALRGASSPVDYAVTLLKSWALSGVRTPEDVDEYLETHGVRSPPWAGRYA